MEDTLRGRQDYPATRRRKSVLILVLMEDTLRATIGICHTVYHSVLILVLMEDTLRVCNFEYSDAKLRLNPCSNGRYSQR